MMKAVGIIPARWGSTRFPGKSLAEVGGKPLILRVLERAKQARSLDSVLVATDDSRIEKTVRLAGGEAVMTRPDHPSGTDRIAECAAGKDVDIIVNIQGDEPLINPNLIDEIVKTLSSDSSLDMATAATPFDNVQSMENPSNVKVLCDKAGLAIYFSRAVIPFVRDKAVAEMDAVSCAMRHVGIYGYRRDFLFRFVGEPPCRMECLEKLEQLRALYLGAKIKVIRTSGGSPGVDTPEDILQAENALRAAGEWD